MESNKIKGKNIQQMDVKEITIGNTIYIVRSNARNVPKAFVKKTVQKLLFSELKQKS